MVKRFMNFFVVCFAAGILFSACPIEYVSRVAVDPPFEIPEGAISFTGQARGYKYALANFEGAPIPPLAESVVEVTLYFYNGAFIWVTTDTQFESADYDPNIANALLRWRNRIRAGGLSVRPPLLDFNYASWESQTYLWPSLYVDLFAGATVSVNVLTRAADDALSQMP
ncbi:MAG: hypothetical protein FWC65_04290 [Treponema sp.]|nr:hypothetical protein [Treponema sp.]